jgi:ligand-binding sensor domain-containing protein
MKYIILIFLSLITSQGISQHWEIFNTENSDIPNDEIINLRIDSNDNIWMSYAHNVYMYDQENMRWYNFNTENSNLSGFINHIEIGFDGSVYIAADGISRYDQKINDFKIIEENINCEYFTFDRNGKLYFVRSVLVYQKDGDNVKSIYDGSVKGPNYPSNLVIDEDNTLWFGTDGFNSGFFNYENNTLERYDSLFLENGRLKSTIITLDGNDKIWHNNGDDAIIFNYNKLSKDWMIYDDKNSPLGDDDYFSKSFSIDNKSNLWVLSALNVTKPPINLYKFDGAIWKSYNIDSVVNLEEDYLLVLDVDVDSKGNVWIASNHGLIKFNENTTSVQSTISDKIKLYPNPTKNILNFDVGEPIVETISITDMRGKKILDFDNTKNYVDITNLSAGQYFITFTTSDGSTIVKKFVKE